MWMKTDFDFGMPYKTFTVSCRLVAIACEIRDRVRALADDPAGLERELMKIIEVHRPDLKGCTIVGIGMPGGLNWQIQVIHPSFPRSPIGEFPQPEPLVGHPEGKMIRDGVWIGDPQEEPPHTAFKVI